MRALLAAILCSIPVVASGQWNCSIRNYNTLIPGDSVSLSVGVGWTAPPDGIFNTAISYWTSVCGDGGSHPTLCAGCQTQANYGVIVHFANSDGPTCGVHDPTFVMGMPVGSQITLFASARGQPCDPIADALAHELGHVLGLNDVSANANCYGSIMGGRGPGGVRTVTAADCAVADEAWVTTQDRVDQCNSTCWTTCDANMQCPQGTLHWDGGTDWFDPLVFDLDGDGIETTSSDDPVIFDLDADGTPERLSWVGPTDAFLWTDLNGNNRIDDGSELFGIGTILPDGAKARHGYEALAMYDLVSRGGDENGRIDAGDKIWNRLRLWLDANHNGVSDAGEAMPIHRYGVESIRLDWMPVRWIDAYGTLHLLRGTYRKHVTGNTASRFDDYLVEALAFSKAP